MGNQQNIIKSKIKPIKFLVNIYIVQHLMLLYDNMCPCTIIINNN